jgi:hypothetical protein
VEHGQYRGCSCFDCCAIRLRGEEITQSPKVVSVVSDSIETGADGGTSNGKKVTNGHAEDGIICGDPSMSIIVHYGLIAARVCVAMLGAILLYLAFFLYEDEAGRYQNRLEQLWIQIDDVSHTALARHTAFLKKTIGLLRFGLDSLFGKRLISVRSVAVTLAYSVGSSFLLVDYGLRGFSNATLRSLFVFLVLLMLGTSLGFVRRANIVRIWSAAVVLLTIYIFIAGLPFVVDRSYRFQELKSYYADITAKDFLQSIFVFAIGIVCDIVFVALNRAIFRFTEQVNSITQIILLLICNLSLAFGYLAPYLFNPVTLLGGHPSQVQEITWAISTTNAITALLASGMVFLTLTAFLHRGFWPLLSRPVYALGRYGAIRNQKLLLTTALLLLTWAIPAWKPFWESVAKL